MSENNELIIVVVKKLDAFRIRGIFPLYFLTPIATSAPFNNAFRNSGISCGLCCPSPSSVMTISASISNANKKPLFNANHFPTFFSLLCTIAPHFLAISCVSSVLPSSITITLSTYFFALRITFEINLASL